MFKSKPIIVLILIVFTSQVALSQTSYFVDQQTGDDANNGLTLSTSVESIDAALNLISAGDTVFIVGEYKNPSYNASFIYGNDNEPHLWHAENSISINNLNGNASAYITIKAFDSNTILKGDGANIFRVQNSSYLRIEGFEVEGEVQNIPLTTANALQFVYIDGNTVSNIFAPLVSDIHYRDQDCVSSCTVGAVVDGEVYSSLSSLDVKRPSYIDTRGMYLSNVHHIEIINNTIHDMPGGGLRVSDCEDIDIVENEIYACSRKSYSGTHALVVTKATSTRTTDDYRINILRNRIHHNYNEQYSWAPTKTVITPHIDEGKGISLQRNQTTYNTDNSINVNWEHGRILVANNLCYYNGFSGVHSNDGNRIDMINNTCYFNSYTKSITEGISSNNGGNIGISAQGGSDIRILNNISIIDSVLSKSAISSNVSAMDGLVVSDNIIYGTSIGGLMGPISENGNVASVQVNMQMIDPLFVDPVNFDFTLQEMSPAVSAANAEAPADDFYGVLRDVAPDLGAIEYVNPNLGVESITTASVKLYPNPVKEILYMDGVDLTKENVEITNMIGQNFDAKVVVINQSIDMSELPSGVYLIRVSSTPYIVLKN